MLLIVLDEGVGVSLCDEDCVLEDAGKILDVAVLSGICPTWPWGMGVR